MKIFTKLLGLKKRETETFINDRRREKRYALPLKLSYLNPVTNFKGDSLTKNICRSGLRFPIDKKLPSGTILELAVESPYGNTMRTVKAEIIWSEDFIAEEDTGEVICEVGVKLIKKRIF